MASPRIYADFQNLDDLNRLRLTSAGTAVDLERQGLQLAEGQRLTFYMDDANEEGRPDELRIEGRVQYDAGSRCWVAAVDWATVYHASDVQAQQDQGAMQVDESSHKGEGSSTFPGVMLCLFGVALLGLAGWLFWESYFALRSGSWPQAEGRIQSSQVVEELRTRSGKQYRIQVRYTYTVDGKTYTGDRFNNRGNYLEGEQGARTAAAGYPPGARCKVSYNPSDPAESVIDSTVTWHTWGKLVLAVIALLLGPGALYLGWREFKPKGGQRTNGDRQSDTGSGLELAEGSS
jgi:hypothetical protein